MMDGRDEREREEKDRGRCPNELDTYPSKGDKLSSPSPFNDRDFE